MRNLIKIVVKQKNAVFLHGIAIFSFLALPFLFTPPHPQNMGNHFFSFLIIKKLITNFLFILFFYFNHLFLIPKLFFTKKYTFFLLSVLFCGFVILFVPLILWKPALEAKKGLIFLELESNFFLFIATFFLSLSFTINYRWQQAEKQKLNAELSFLKAQIQPHFLFNTLHCIYALAIKKSDQTASAIVKLSAMMRYLITEENKDFVDLEKEINYLENYVALQKMRLANTAKIDFEVIGKFKNQKIAPLILVCFIENVFKHGIDIEQQIAVEIKIKIEDQAIILQTSNPIFEAEKEKSTGSLGIANTKKRLELLYNDKYKLKITENTNHYLVYLKINLI